MRAVVPALRAVLGGAQGRFVRSRPGSVLLLVVAMLVLMALIGTAFLTMAQSDRVAAVQHENNTEIDLLLDGLINMVKGAVVNELFAGGAFRSANPTYDTGAVGVYDHWTGVGLDPASLTAGTNVGTTFLADRIPGISAPIGTPLTGNNHPTWGFISAPITAGQFATPYYQPGARPFLLGQQADVYHYTQRSSAAPGAMAPLYPGAMTLPGGAVVPAWVDNPANVARSILAADADGDGIADAGLVKLPMGAINGVTYYAAVRIVDNAAAVNASVATWQNTTGPLPGDFFPTNISLQGMLTQTNATVGGPIADSLNSLMAYRAGFPQQPPSSTPVDISTSRRTDFTFLTDAAFGPGMDGLWMQLGRQLDNPGLVIPGSLSAYQALPPGDTASLAHQFIVPLPGLSCTLQNELPVTTLYSPSGHLGAYAPTQADLWFSDHFWYSPTGQYPNAAPSPVPNRALLVARNPVTNFAPNKYRAATGASEFDFGDQVTLNGRAYVFIGWQGASSAVYLGTYPNGNFYPGAKAGLLWVPEPWADAPTKVSVNTGTFGQLLTAFWSVMADRNVAVNPSSVAGGTISPPGSPPPPPITGTDFRPFANPARDPTEGMQGPVSALQAPTVTRPVNRITSGRPVPRYFELTPVEVIKLRAALAAVNTMTLRGSGAATGPSGAFNFSSASQRIFLNATLYNSIAVPPYPEAATIEADVFGVSPQPYIVAVYAENDNVTKLPSGAGPNPQGYVGIELYNPYPFAIDLTNWNVGVLAGRTYTPPSSSSSNSSPPTGASAPSPIAPTYPFMKLMPILQPTTPPTGTAYQGMSKGYPTGNPPPVIQPNSYLVLENLPPSGSAGLSPTDAVYRPTLVDPTYAPVPTQAPVYYYVPNLSLVMQDPNNLNTQPGGELVLLRPRQASIAAPASSTSILSYTLSSATWYSESPANFYDLMPADSFDFTGLSLASSALMTGIYYSRTAGPPHAVQWQFIYPGRWDATQPFLASGVTSSFRQEGTRVGQWDTSTRGSDMNFKDPQLQQWGTPTTATYTNNFPPIRLDCTAFPNGTGFPGPFPALVPTATATNQFPFGAFARNGDILQVPFIGAYRLRLFDRLNLDGTVTPLPQPPGFPAPNDPASIMLELNPVTLDSQQADDYDSFAGLGQSDDTAENIGRFCPIDGADVPGSNVDDFNPLTPANWRYRWAMSLFDYLTVQSPQDDQLPQVDPITYLSVASPSPTLPPPQPVKHNNDGNPPPQTYGRVISIVRKPSGAWFVQETMSLASDFYLLGSPSSYNGTAVQFLTGGCQGFLAQIQHVSNSGPPWTIEMSAPIALPGVPPPSLPATNDIFVLLGTPEPAAALNGLVNVNTASWRVLAAVPFVPNVQLQNAPLNTDIALSIIRYRDVMDPVTGVAHGPFQSLFELNRVPLYHFTPGSGATSLGITFRDAMTRLANNPAGLANHFPFTLQYGDLTGTGSSGMGDFAGTFLMMNRVSNLLTTRSDSFTAYVLLQGWRNAETPDATLAVQRRAAFLIDRTGVTSLNPSPTITFVPGQ